MTENTTPETTAPETDDVEAHRQQVRREFTEQDGGRGRLTAFADGGDDDVQAHMTKVPVGRRESVDEDEDVRAHSSQPEGAADEDAEAHLRHMAVDATEGEDTEGHRFMAMVDGEESADDVEAHARVVQVDGDDDAEKNARRL